MTMEFSPDGDDMILITDHDDVTLHDKSVFQHCFMMMHGSSNNPECPGLTGPLLSRFMSKLKQRLSPRLKIAPDMSPDLISAGSHASKAQPWPCEQPIRDGSFADIMFVSHGPFGIVDLGASQTVIGQQQVPELLNHLPVPIRSKVKKVPCSTMFRFGNSSTVECQEALLVPLQRWHVKVCIVPSRTPFLISNDVFRTLGAQIDTASDSVHFAQIGVKMSLKLTAKKLYLLDFFELVKLALRNPGNISQNETETDGSVMFASETALIPDRKPSENHNLKPSSEAQNVSDAQPLCALSDPDQHGQPVRALSGCDIREDQGQLPEDVLRSAGQSTHCLRGSKIESQNRIPSTQHGLSRSTRVRRSKPIRSSCTSVSSTRNDWR